MQNNRLEVLDSLRGLAALFVVLYHYTTRYYDFYKVEKDYQLSFTYGNYGVEVFFIISGFVIFLTLSKTKTSLDFIVNRFIRLFPTYWISVTLTFIIISQFSLPGREVSILEYIINLSMIHLEFRINSVDGVYWTLLYELKFYVLMLLLYHFNLLKKINYLSLFILVVIVFLNMFSLNETILFKILNKIFIFNYIHLFISGIMFYKIMKKDYNPLIFLNLLISYLLAIYSQNANIIIIFSSIYFIFILLSLGKLKFLSQKSLIFLGSISYSLYLIHQNIGYIVLNFFSSNNLSMRVGTISAFIISIFIATGITYLFEKNMIIYLKNRYKLYKIKKNHVE